MGVKRQEGTARNAFLRWSAWHTVNISLKRAGLQRCRPRHPLKEAIRCPAFIISGCARIRPLLMHKHSIY
eukprot:1140507-Pelagomonas_calceolata.AAC.1